METVQKVAEVSTRVNKAEDKLDNENKIAGRKRQLKQVLSLK